MAVSERITMAQRDYRFDYGVSTSCQVVHPLAGDRPL